MKNITLIKTIVFFTFLLFVKPKSSFAQNHTIAFAAADSTRFSVNNNGGWKLFNSYIHKPTPDTAELELIVQHTNNINWSQEHYVGKIKFSPAIPLAPQNIPFNLSNGSFILRVDTNGKCFLRFLSGVLPAVNPIVLPFKVSYTVL